MEGVYTSDPGSSAESQGVSMTSPVESVTLENDSESYDEVEKKRQLVREELEKMKDITEKEMEKFGKLLRFGPESDMFPELRLSKFHTVTFNLEEQLQAFSKKEEIPPYPRRFSPKWNLDFVPMPCSDEYQKVIQVWKTSQPEFDYAGNLLPAKKIKTDKRVLGWDYIKRILEQPIASSDDLNRRINRIRNRNIMFNVLKYTIEEVMTPDEGYNFFAETLPYMVKLCTELPRTLTSAIPLLKRYKHHSISLTQKQIAALLANAFFCTFPPRLENDGNYPSINFEDLYSCEPSDERKPCMANKLRCILLYFERLASAGEVHNGVVTFTRKSYIPAKCPDWNNSKTKLKTLVALCNGTIETEGAGMLQVDFANKYVGGGVLGRGAVQEEILFVIYPELLISRLFTEKLLPGEALLVTGCERFSSYAGYSLSFKYNGDFRDNTKFDRSGRRLSQIVAIDAHFIRKSMTQFNPRLMEVELNKAYAGFSIPPGAKGTPVAIASGKWGCGAFNGNPELKSILQLLAASECGRDLVIFTFGDTELGKTLSSLVELFKNKTVQDVWKLLKQYFSIFCSANENSDAPPGYSLSQFFMEFVAAEDVYQKDEDETDKSSGSALEYSGKISDSHVPMSIGAQADMNGSFEDIKIVEVSDEDRISMSMHSKIVDEKQNQVITGKELKEDNNNKHIIIDITDDEEDMSSSLQKTPTKLNPPLTELYKAPLTTPKKIGAMDFDSKSSTEEESDEMFPSLHLYTNVRSVSHSTLQDTTRHQRIISFAISEDEDDDTNVPISKPVTPKQEKSVDSPGSKVKTIVTAEDYDAVFGSSPRSVKIHKHATSKRRLNMSHNEGSRSSYVRPKQSSTHNEMDKGMDI